MRSRLLVGVLAVSLAGCGGDEASDLERDRAEVRDVIRKVEDALVAGRADVACRYATDDLVDGFFTSSEYHPKKGPKTCRGFVEHQLALDTRHRRDRTFPSWVDALRTDPRARQVRILKIDGEKAHVRIPAADEDYLLIETPDGWKVDSGSSYPFDGTTGL